MRFCPWESPWTSLTGFAFQFASMGFGMPRCAMDKVTKADLAWTAIVVILIFLMHGMGFM